MNEATAWSVIAVVGGCVFIALIVSLTAIVRDETRLAMENGYEQRPSYPGSAKFLWVKAPVSATNATPFQR
jgi:hypothetical protein